MIQFFGRLMKLPLEALVYSVEMLVKTMHGVQEIAYKGIDTMTSGMSQTLVDTPASESKLPSTMYCVPDDALSKLVQDTRQPTQKELHKMRDTDLDNDRVKLVKYTIVTIKRGREEILKSGGEQLVTQRLSGEAFASWMIAKYIQEHKSEMDEEDKQYLRVYYDVMESWPKQDLKYEENRLKYEEGALEQLRGIKEAIERKGGGET